MLHSVGNGENQSECHLCHAVGAVSRNVGHDDALFSGSLDVYDVEASGLDADVFQTGQLAERLGIHLYLIDKDNVGILGPFYFLSVGSAWVYGNIAEFFQSMPV